MTFSDPLQWLVISAFIIVALVIAIYLVLRVLTTLNKLDKYLNEKASGPKAQA